MTAEERIKEIERHVAELAEVYDVVTVMGSWLTPEGQTKSHKRGSGNFYARLGLCHEMIKENDQQDQADTIAQKLNPPDDFLADF